jgi:hypothetical protein
MKLDLFFQSIKDSKEISEANLQKEGQTLWKMQPQNQDGSLVLPMWQV